MTEYEKNLTNFVQSTLLAMIWKGQHSSTKGVEAMCSPHPASSDGRLQCSMHPPAGFLQWQHCIPRLHQPVLSVASEPPSLILAPACNEIHTWLTISALSKDPATRNSLLLSGSSGLFLAGSLSFLLLTSGTLEENVGWKTLST